MQDLFDVPVLPGIASLHDLVTPSEERALIVAIEAQELTPFKFHQWEGKRLTHNFGWRYDFETEAVRRADPVPAWLREVRDRLAALAGLEPRAIVQAGLIRYDVGAGIGWHRDRPHFEDVLGLSLGAPATMRFRRKEGPKWRRASLPLDPRGAYHLSGEARHDWEHSIAPMDRTRYAITMRTASALGRTAFAAAA